MSTAVEAVSLAESPAEREAAPESSTSLNAAGASQNLHAELERTRQSLATLTRERQITRELFALGAIDLDITGALLERDLVATPQGEIAAVAAQLKQRRPSLFRRPGGLDSLRDSEPDRSSPKPAAHSMTMSPKASAQPQTRDQIAAAARGTNSRTKLLEYMRLKRQPAD